MIRTALLLGLCRASAIRAATGSGVLALVVLFGTACNNPDPKVSGTPEFDDRLIERYRESQVGIRDEVEGMIQTPSGLRYQVLRPGTGSIPSYRDTVLVHYRGWNEQGAVFDESYRKGRPMRLRLDTVIEGWGEGLQLMREGARFRFVIPPYLAYGSRGLAPRIGPDETLVFEVELIEVQ